MFSSTVFCERRGRKGGRRTVLRQSGRSFRLRSREELGIRVLSAAQRFRAWENAKSAAARLECGVSFAPRRDRIPCARQKPTVAGGDLSDDQERPRRGRGIFAVRSRSSRSCSAAYKLASVRAAGFHRLKLPASQVWGERSVFLLRYPARPSAAQRRQLKLPRFSKVPAKSPIRLVLSSPFAALRFSNPQRVSVDAAHPNLEQRS